MTVRSDGTPVKVIRYFPKRVPNKSGTKEITRFERHILDPETGKFG